MPKRKKKSHGRTPRQERRFVVRGVRREKPDMRKLGRALLSLAQAEAEREAQAQHTAQAATEDEREDTPSTDGGDKDDRRGS
ncbi:hypothetical protein [Nocardiopsis changdeensis]|uniref:hypothetical protein n=1 Tax=Nocardiopsis changdeensis TaxID=2831969 RepID=UPI003F4819E3